MLLILITSAFIGLFFVSEESTTVVVSIILGNQAILAGGLVATFLIWVVKTGTFVNS